MSKEYPLDGFALEIKAHWQKYRPKMYAQLQREGKRTSRSTRLRS